MKLMELKVHIDNLIREGYGNDPVKVEGQAFNGKTLVTVNQDIIRPRIECGPGFTNVEIVLLTHQEI